MSALAVLAPTLIAKVTALLLLAALFDRVTPRRHFSAATRHFVLSLAVLGVLLVPVLMLSLPAWHVGRLLTRMAPLPLQKVSIPALPEKRGGIAIAAEDERETSSAAANAVADVEHSGVRRASLPPRGSSDRMRTERTTHAAAATSAWIEEHSLLMLVSLWLAGTALLIVRIALEQRAIRRLTQESRMVSDTDTRQLLRLLGADAGITRTVILLESDRAAMPLTWGVRHPHVLVPMAWHSWSDDRRRAVLQHELAHIARFDCLTGLFAAVGCALYWFHPGMWWLSRRLRAEQELACDDAVVRGGVPALDYARHLLEIARHATSVAPTSPAPSPLHTLAVHMATPSTLEARMLAVIDPSRRRRAAGPRARTATVVASALLLLPMAAVDARDTSHVRAVPAADGRRAARVGPAVATTLQTHPKAAPTPVALDTVTISHPMPLEARAVVESLPVPAAVIRAGGTWHMRPASTHEAIDGMPSVHVMLNTRGLNTFVVPQAKLDGLSPEQMQTGSAPVRFRLVRDAGTLVFNGLFQDGRGSGAFEFVPDSSFTAALQQRGLTAPSSDMQFSMGLHDVGLDLLDELLRQGYQRPTTTELARLGLTSVDTRWLRDMDALGYRFSSIATLMSLTNHSIDAAYIARANASAGRRLEARELLAQRMRGETTAPMTQSAAERGASTAAGNATPPRAGGTPATSTTATTPTSGRWVLNIVGNSLQLELQWNDDTQWRRPVTPSELHGLSTSVLASPTELPAAFSIDAGGGRFVFDGALRTGRGAGRFTFDIDRRFVDTLRTLGVQGIAEVSDHALKNLVWGGLTASYVRDILALGYPNVTAEELVELAIRNVSLPYARAMREAGVAEAASVRGLAELRFVGVPADYVTEMAALGYRGLALDQIRDLRRAGVTPGFVRSLNEAGVRNLTPEALIRRRRGRA